MPETEVKLRKLRLPKLLKQLLEKGQTNHLTIGQKGQCDYLHISFRRHGEISEPPEEEQQGLHKVISLFDGIVRRKPGPEHHYPLVTLGDQVAVGQTLCFVETPEILHSVNTDTAGVVVKVCAVTGDSVKEGDVLMVIDTNSVKPVS